MNGHTLKHPWNVEWLQGKKWDINIHVFISPIWNPSRDEYIKAERNDNMRTALIKQRMQWSVQGSKKQNGQQCHPQRLPFLRAARYTALLQNIRCFVFRCGDSTHQDIHTGWQHKTEYRACICSACEQQKGKDNSEHMENMRYSCVQACVAIG